MKHFIFLFLVSLVGFSASAQDSIYKDYEKNSYELSNDSALNEWKKFKQFQAQLKLSKSNSQLQEEQIKSYAKDSLQILEVKLTAIKVLDQKGLLDRDIAENQEYYLSLLSKLKNSDVNAKEYLFLEKKLAYLINQDLKKELANSRWLNLGLGAMCFVSVFTFLYFRKRQKTPIPELSQQEKTVQHLILEGKSNKEIASELFISLSTVKSHITNLYSKLNVANRKELMQKYTGAST